MIEIEIRKEDEFIKLGQALKKAGLVESTRGACGGYRLGKAADSISVGDVLRVLEGSLEAAQCPGNDET